MTSHAPPPPRHPRPSPRSFRPALARAALALGAVASAGCSLWVAEATDVCSSDADCGARGEAFAGAVCDDGICRRGAAPPVDPKWGCVGDVDVPAPERAEATVAFTMTILGPMQPAVGSTIKACFRTDRECAAPVVTPVVTDGAGKASLALPTNLAEPGSTGFNGYFEITGPQHSPYLYFLSPPVAADREVATPLGSLDNFGRLLSASVPGLTLDPARAFVSMVGLDCTRRPATGVRFQTTASDAQTRGFYLLNRNFSTEATATDATGLGLLTNVPTGPGTATLVAESDEAGGRIASQLVLVRPGYVTAVEMPPTP